MFRFPFSFFVAFDCLHSHFSATKASYKADIRSCLDLLPNFTWILAETHPVWDEDVARLSPFIHEKHINLLGRYSFAVPEVVARGELRQLRNPNEEDA
jgi:hypothetical protein